MNDDRLQQTAKRIWDLHRAAGRDTENPPSRVARAETGSRWVEVWVTGLDTIAWFYRLSNHQREPVLIATNMSEQSNDPLEVYDPLLQPLRHLRVPTREQWQQYAQTWLTQSA